MTVNSVEERILAAARYKLNMDEKVICSFFIRNHWMHMCFTEGNIVFLGYSSWNV